MVNFMPQIKITRSKVIKFGKTAEDLRKIRTEYAMMRFFNNKPEYRQKYLFDRKNKVLERDIISGKPICFNSRNLKKLAQTLVKLHEMKLNKFGRVGIRDSIRKNGTFKDAIIYYADLLSSEIKKRGDSDNKYLKILNQIKSKIRNLESSKNKDFSLIHRDLHKGNILIDKQETIRLIDWGSATVWDPALDLALLINKNKLSRYHRGVFLKEYLSLTSDKEIYERIKLYIPLVKIADNVFN